MTIRGWFDGAARGNPGPAGAGALLTDGTQVLWQAARPLGQCTNNEAEYSALALLLEEVERRDLTDLEICGDSRLVVEQMKGAWKIREPRLAALAEPLKIIAMERGLRFLWVPREQNSQADALSNYALDEGELNESNMAKEKQVEEFQISPVGRHCWLITDGSDEFVIDTAHGVCSCPQWQKKKNCRHMERLVSSK